jgi:D-sedoheptulose 7-phosphate isomerase
MVDAKDNRFKNQTYTMDSMASYLKEYGEQTAMAYKNINPNSVNALAETLAQAIKRGAMIYTCGNGGSATIADQMSTDWGKGISVDNHIQARVVSLSSNTGNITAYGNDVGYDLVFAEQLKTLAQAGDVLVCVSSSGNSPNVLAAVEQAKKMKVKTISFTGFDGGKLKPATDINVHVPIKNYGVVEDCHQGIMHIAAQYLFLKLYGELKQNAA